MAIASTNRLRNMADGEFIAPASARCETDDIVTSEHAVVAGHFPGNPVVPAVLILDRVRRAYVAWRRPVAMTRIVRVKFVSVLRPDEAFTIELKEDAGHRCVFSCRKSNGEKFALGEFMTGQGNNGS